MSEENDAPISGNAVNHPWSIDRVYEVLNEGTPGKRSPDRGEAFASVLHKRLPDENQTDIMLEIAQKMGEMKHGDEAILIYTGHPSHESVSNPPDNPAISVIERLEYPAYHYLPFPAEQSVWAIAELYRQSPVCKPSHRNASSKRLESKVRDIMQRYPPWE